MGRQPPARQSGRTRSDGRGSGVNVLHVVASTGRTATSLIAACFDRLPGIAACHEGHRGNDDGPDLLPLVNLENSQIFRDPSVGARVVAAKRSDEILDDALRTTGERVLVDVAYYNAVLGDAILEAHPASRMVGIVRDCESFVRSVTWLTGTDPMPVGWPHPDKELTMRERFVSMGRLRPTEGADKDAWPSWGPIERNIWLWRETNARICDTHDRWPDRVTLLDFSTIGDGSVPFLRSILDALELAGPSVAAEVASAAAAAAEHTNERTGGYQIGTAADWSPQERSMLTEATTEIERRMG